MAHLVALSIALVELDEVPAQPLRRRGLGSLDPQVNPKKESEL